MAKDPFYYELDQEYRGTRVRVFTDEFEYEGWCRMWHYDQHAILLFDTVRNGSEDVGAVTINEPKTVEKIESGPPIRTLDVEAIEPSPYNARSYDSPDHQIFVKQTRERGHLLTFPEVRRVSPGTFETVSGHRRLEAARRADLDELAVRLVEMSDWEATQRFVDEHIPVEGGDERKMYGQQEIDAAIAGLRSDWDDERLRELAPLRPYLEEKLASTRSEAIRQGYL